MPKSTDNKYKAALDAAGIPWPGTKAARVEGCTCVRQSAARNLGIQVKYDCPIHGKLFGTLVIDEGRIRMS